MAFYMTKSEPRRTSTPLDKDAYYRIEWGDGPTYTIICDDEVRRCQYTHHHGDIIGVTPLIRRSNTFVTIGLDHNIQIATTSGRQHLLLQGHTARILGIIEIDDKTLLSASEDGFIRLWNSKTGSEIAVISTAIHQLNQIKMLHGDKQFAACEESRVTIWDIDGAQITSLFDVTKELEGIRLLSSGCWLLSCKKARPGIWNALGEHLTTFPFFFDIATELFDLSNQQLLIQRSGDVLTLWDEQGVLLASHSASPEIIKVFHCLNQGVNKAGSQMRNKPDVIDYPHSKNPMGHETGRLNARRELEQQNIDLHNPTRRLFWNFFSRPQLTPIKAAMKDIIRSAREQVTSINKAVQTAQAQRIWHRKKQSQLATWSWSWFILALLAGGFAGAAYINLPGVVNLAKEAIHMLTQLPAHQQPLVVSAASAATGALLLYFSFCCLLKNRRHHHLAEQQEANLAILSLLPDEFYALMARIKQYRRNLSNTLPLMNNPHLLSGDAVKKAILEQVEGPLKQMALDECGITCEEVMSSDHQAIILRDWALIQNRESGPITDNINPSNAHSFWPAAGEMLFAVQCIHYLFLTRDKVNIFTTYYDFIAGKCMAKQVNTFAYQDLTHSAKHQLQRNHPSAVNKPGLSTTEITFADTSGARMTFSILNDDGVSALIDSARDNEEPSTVQRIERIKEKKRQIEYDTCLSDAEKQEERAYLNAEIRILQSQTVKPPAQQQMHKAQQAIGHIHARMIQHKSAAKLAHVTL